MHILHMNCFFRWWKRTFLMSWFYANFEILLILNDRYVDVKECINRVFLMMHLCWRKIFYLNYLNAFELMTVDLSLISCQENDIQMLILSLLTILKTQSESIHFHWSWYLQSMQFHQYQMLFDLLCKCHFEQMFWTFLRLM